MNARLRDILAQLERDTAEIDIFAPLPLPSVNKTIEGYYITDVNGQRMRDGQDQEFIEPTMEAVEQTIYYYFDVGYGDLFYVFDAANGVHVDTFLKETFDFDDDEDTP